MSSKQPPNQHNLPAEDNRNFFLADCLVQPELNRILKSGTVLAVEPRNMQVLVYLAQHVFEVVPRAQLIALVWANSAINEEALTRSISDLRKHLGDNAKKPLFIQTIHKTGYRLLVQPEYRPAEINKPHDSLATTRKMATPWFSPFKWHWPIWLLLTVLLAFFYFRLQPMTSQADPNRSVTAVPFTSFPGREIYPAFSPNGTSVAFSWNGGRGVNFNIFIKQLVGETVLKITDHDGTAYHATWSPSGSEIAFVQSADDQSDIMRVSSLGGSAQRLIRSDASWIHGLSWSPTDDFLVFAGADEASQPCRISLLSLSDLQVQVLTKPPANSAGDYSPVFSPNGKLIAFLRKTIKHTSCLYVVSPESGTARQITDHLSTIHGFDFTPDGKHIVFSTTDQGKTNLKMVSISDRKPKFQVLHSQMAENLTVASNAKRLIYQKNIHDINILRIETASTAAPTPIIESTYSDTTPSYSPNGEMIAFSSARSGNSNIWICDKEGHHPRMLTNLKGAECTAPRWSRDGKRIAFQVQSDGQVDAYFMGSDGGPIERITQHQADDLPVDWSPDGQWLYFASDRSGSWQIWRASVKDRHASQVTHHGAFSAVLSEDGNFLYYTKIGKEGLWKMNLQDGQESMTHRFGWPGKWANWDVIGKNIYFIDSDDHGTYISCLNSESGKRKIVSRINNIVNFSFTVSPDEKSILFAQVEDLQSDLILLENYR